MEEDRERHKRLRENMWVLPISGPRGMVTNGVERPAAAGVRKLKAGGAATLATPIQGSSATSPASPSDAPAKEQTSDEKQEAAVSEVLVELDPVEVEFDQIWEVTSDFDEDDKEDIVA